MRLVAERRDQLQQIGLAGAFALASVAAGGFVANPSFVRMAFAACLGAFVVGLGLRVPRPVLYGMVVWLAALGLTRRLLSHGFAAPGAADPLLLVEPLMLGILLVVASDRGAFRLRTPLGRAVTVLAWVFALGALNPLQGSLFAGLSSLIFFLPIGAFWIGRMLDTRTFKIALVTYAVCAVPAALYGLYQISSGFPSWDQAWIDSSGYSALQIGSATRPFSAFSSASEYATFLAAGIVIWLAVGRRALRPVALAAIALLGISVVYQSSRGAVVQLAAAVVLMLGARRGLPLWASVVVGAALLAFLPTAVRHFAPESYGTSNKSQLIAHEVNGLANPFDSESSTASAHISLLVNGIKGSIHEPLGRGISAVTIAGSKFGGKAAAGAEADPANAAIATGLPGLLAYLVVFCLAIGGAYRLAQRTGSPLAVASLGLLVALAPQWLNGGQYAVGWLPWLVLGWVDATSARAAAAAHEEEGEGETAAPVALPALRPVARPRPAKRQPRLVPRRWELWRLERLAQGQAGVDPERDELRRYLLFALRPYVAYDERLPLEFDGLVREEFGALLEDE